MEKVNHKISFGSLLCLVPGRGKRKYTRFLRHSGFLQLSYAGLSSVYFLLNEGVNSRFRCSNTSIWYPSSHMPTRSVSNSVSRCILTVDATC